MQPEPDQNGRTGQNGQNGRIGENGPDGRHAASAVTDVDVVVVGGGLAGLTCALGLSDSGLRVAVIERDVRLGGRAQSWTDETTGDPVHIGPHIFLSHYPNTWRLLDLLGTRDRVVWQRNGRFITLVDGRHEIAIEGSSLPSPAHFLPSLLRDPHNRVRDVASNWWAVQAAIDLDQDAILRLDQINASAYLRSMGVTDRFLQRFWAFTAMAIMNVPLELCSAGALMRFFHHLIGHRSLDIGFADRGLGDLFAPQARARIEAASGVVQTHTEVQGFLGNDDQVTGVRLADGRTIRARFCVAALPPQVLRRLARPAWIQRHRSFADLVHFLPVPYVSVYLWFDRKLTEQQFWARTFVATDLNCDFYDLSNIHTGWQQRPSVIASNIIYCHRAEAMSDDAIVAATRAELAEYLPGAATARLVHARVHRIPMAIHAPHPGTEGRRPDVRTPVRGLFLAGDWIQTNFPASMESAVASGWMAAEQIHADLGQPRQLRVSQPPVEGLMQLVRQVGRRLPMRRLMRSEVMLRRLG